MFNLLLQHILYIIYCILRDHVVSDNIKYPLFQNLFNLLECQLLDSFQWFREIGILLKVNYRNVLFIYSRLRLIEPPRDQVVLTRLSGETD